MTKEADSIFKLDKTGKVIAEYSPRKDAKIDSDDTLNAEDKAKLKAAQAVNVEKGISLKKCKSNGNNYVFDHIG